MEIRRERPGDHEAVAAVHRAAFARPGVAAEEVVEFALVDRLRTGPWSLPHLSLVAVLADTVVGHVIATRAVIEPSGTPALGVGPPGVAPDRQRSGIGSALMHAVLRPPAVAGTFRYAEPFDRLT